MAPAIHRVRVDDVVILEFDVAVFIERTGLRRLEVCVGFFSFSDMPVVGLAFENVVFSKVIALDNLIDFGFKRSLSFVCGLL